MNIHDIAKQIRHFADQIESQDMPSPKPDPYAELKKAHAEGKVIQTNGYGDWLDLKDGSDMTRIPFRNLRIKPEPAFQLPSPPPKETVLTGKGFTVRITYHEGKQQ